MTGGLNIISRSVDSDAMAYCSRSGAPDRKTVSDFVRGLKGLGLWNSIVEAWPLLISQNAGVGITANGLKGLADMALVNGAIWGSEGIACIQANTQYITTLNLTAFQLASQVTIMLVLNTTGASNFSNFAAAFGKTQGGGAFTHNYQFQSNSGARSMNFVCGDGVSSSTALSVGTIGNTSKHCMIGSCKAGGNTIVKLDNGATSSTTNSMSQLGVSGDPLNFARSAVVGAVFSDAEYSFGAVFSAALTSTEMDSLYSIYKNTLGRGLSLP